LSLHGSLPIFFHIKTDDNKETIIKSDSIFAPNDEELLAVFMGKYKFIEKINIL